MSDYPTDRVGRVRRRAEIRVRTLAAAEQSARTMGRSIKCSGGAFEQWPKRHEGDPDGCANDGSNCICECHDPNGDDA